LSLSRPNARISIDGRTLGADEAALVRLHIDLGQGGAHDQASLQLWPRSKFADAASGAKLQIELGERGDEEPVFSGEIYARRLQPQAVLLEGLAATVALSREHKSQSYLDQTVADIVRDLAGSIGIDKVEADLRLNAYHVDNRRSVWSHLRALAALVGADLGAAADGGLRFLPAAGALLPVTLRHGAELLDWDLALGTAPQPAEVAAYGSASESGDQRWHWLAHDPVGAAAGATRLPAALATRDGAQAIAEALQKRAERSALSGHLLLQGRPDLRPGDTVKVSGLPGANPGPLRVRAVRHSLESRSGFLTRLQVEAGDAGPLGGLL
jgi:phage protein D